MFKLLSKLSLSNFRVSRLKKINNLLKKKVFKIINKQDVFVEIYIFNIYFIN